MSNLHLQVLALFIINRGGTYANTYRLWRVMSMFDVYSEEVIADLQFNEYVNTTLEDQINYYYITAAGKKFMNENASEARDVLEKQFPDKAELIHALIHF